MVRIEILCGFNEILAFTFAICLTLARFVIKFAIQYCYYFAYLLIKERKLYDELVLV